jgi:hypothetical protein
MYQPAADSNPKSRKQPKASSKKAAKKIPKLVLPQTSILPQTLN